MPRQPMSQDELQKKYDEIDQDAKEKKEKANSELQKKLDEIDKRYKERKEHEENYNKFPKFEAMFYMYGKRSNDDYIRIKSFEERFPDGLKFIISHNDTCGAMRVAELIDIYAMLDIFSFDGYVSFYIKRTQALVLSRAGCLISNSKCFNVISIFNFGYYF